MPAMAIAGINGTYKVVGADNEVSYTAVLLSQGKHRFYTLAMRSEMLAETCVVDPRMENPIDGFQRLLDKRRTQEIADYIDKGFGTIPGSIVLSAQPEAKLRYIRKARTIRFQKTPRSFLIIDGQHRVYGFKLAKESLRVPVVIYNGLSKADEARLFMDINTKQRPVPPELILDIKRLAEDETDVEAVLRDVYDAFNSNPKSPLQGLLTPSERQKGKLSRVTFNNAMRAIWYAFSDSDAQSIYNVLVILFRRFYLAYVFTKQTSTSQIQRCSAQPRLFFLTLHSVYPTGLVGSTPQVILRRS